MRSISAADPGRETARRIERKTGEFRRRLSLRDLADPQNIKAKPVKVVPEIAIPKLAREKPRRNAVEAA